MACDLKSSQQSKRLWTSVSHAVCRGNYFPLFANWFPTWLHTNLTSLPGSVNAIFSLGAHTQPLRIKGTSFVTAPILSVPSSHWVGSIPYAPIQVPLTATPCTLGSCYRRHLTPLWAKRLASHSSSHLYLLIPVFVLTQTNSDLSFKIKSIHLVTILLPSWPSTRRGDFWLLCLICVPY